MYQGVILSSIYFKIFQHTLYDMCVYEEGCLNGWVVGCISQMGIISLWKTLIESWQARVSFQRCLNILYIWRTPEIWSINITDVRSDFFLVKWVVFQMYGLARYAAQALSLFQEQELRWCVQWKYDASHIYNFKFSNSCVKKVFYKGEIYLI